MPRFSISSEHRSFAKEQRRLPTRAEAALWHVLRAGCLGFKFKRQVPVGVYTVDFICLEKRLIVELDGPPHDNPEQRMKDAQRDAWLRSQNFVVLRLSNDLALGAIEIAVQYIVAALNSPSPDPR